MWRTIFLWKGSSPLKTQKYFYSAFHIASYMKYAEVHFQSSYSFKFFEFHDFRWPFQVFHELRFSYHFREFSKSSVFKGILQTPALVSKRVLFALSNYSFLSHFVLALLSAVINLPNKTFIFHDFQRSTIKLYNFSGLEIEFFKSFKFFNSWSHKPAGKNASFFWLCKNDLHLSTG